MAGIDGAQAGVFMPAHPRVGQPEPRRNSRLMGWLRRHDSYGP